LKILKEYKTIFWDFDGVIKDSVKAKSKAFEKIFLPYGKEVALKVTRHHESNSGVSRFIKLPIYLEWTGQTPSKSLINKFEKEFSLLAKQYVINSDWIDGVLDYLKNNYKVQDFFLITATPQQEIKEILEILKIHIYFRQVVGSPSNKDEAIEVLMNMHKINVKQAVMIGDSIIDYNAALSNQIDFILLRNTLNKSLQGRVFCHMIDNFHQ
jgi:phosphoglycolate phosphatase-like HAD superfamily hydrolase